MLQPAESISTAKFAFEQFLVPNANKQPVNLSLAATPYMPGIMDAMDIPGVSIVGVKGPSRIGKTISAEAKLCKILKFGPVMNILWFMQSKDDLTAYVDERFDWYLNNIPEITAKIDPYDSKNGRFRVDVGGALVQLFAATQRALRGKSGLYIVADEIDAYAKAVRAGILTLVRNRQIELGQAAFAFFASHPDAGPVEGIDSIIAQGLRHLWFMRCPMRECGEASSFAAEADEFGRRINWNVSDLLALQNEMPRLELFEMVKEKARLVCPHCGSLLPDEARLEMSAGGVWLQPGQKLNPNGSVDGAPRINQTMGFVTHGMMSTFRNLGDLARAWTVAKVAADDTMIDGDLREVEVKSLGLTYAGSQLSHQIDAWETVKARLTAGYEIRTVPARCLFLTAFVDVQGNRFEVVVIGWNLASESWLIDRYAIKQWPAMNGRPAFTNLDPANRVADWSIIESLLAQSYPLQGDPRLFMPIAKIMVNNAGHKGETSGGVVNNGRIWWSNLMASGRADQYRITLFQGAASKKGERYGRGRPVTHDENGHKLPIPAIERTLNVHEIKNIIAARMHVEEDGAPGRMHLPGGGFNDRYVRELTAERIYNGDWIRQGANETWDGWVACEAGRAILQPDREGMWDDGPPPWAKPMPREEVLGSSMRRETGNIFDRLLGLNNGDEAS